VEGLWLFETVKIETRSRQIETPIPTFLTFFWNLKLKINVWLKFAWRQTEFAFARYGWTSVQVINFLSTLFETTRPSLLELNYPLKVSLKWKSTKIKIKSVSLFCKNIMQCLITFKIACTMNKECLLNTQNNFYLITFQNEKLKNSKTIPNGDFLLIVLSRILRYTCSTKTMVEIKPLTFVMGPNHTK
jgi:hypothetical protein